MKIGSIAITYAGRSLRRHARRTALSIVGVGIGSGMALLAFSWMGGALAMQVRAIAESGSGHLRVVPDGWRQTHANVLRLAEDESVLAAVRALPALKAYAPRARTTGLLACGNRTAGVTVTGIDPDLEPAANRILQRCAIEGRFLRAGDQGQAVIGRALAKRLGVGIGDDLYATVAGRDDIATAMLRVAGIMDTGSRDLETSICHITLEDMARLVGLGGLAEVSILLRREEDMPAAIERLTATLPAGNAVMTWEELNPEFASGRAGDRAFMRGLAGIVVLVVSLGIASAQLTAVLERRTEFAILSALGMKRSQVTALVLMEALFIGLGGAVVALLIGGSGAYYLATHGVDFSAVLDGDMGFGDMLFDPCVHGAFGPWLVWHAIGISLVSTVFASIYPARLATRIQPADALRTG